MLLRGSASTTKEGGTTVLLRGSQQLFVSLRTYKTCIDCLERDMNASGARLSALPQEIRIILRYEAMPIIFRSVDEVTDFLENPSFSMGSPQESYVYQVTYSDGTEFETTVTSIAELQELNGQVQRLAEHMANLK